MLRAKSPTFKFMYDLLEASPRRYEIVIGRFEENGLGYNQNGMAINYNPYMQVGCVVSNARIFPEEAGLTHEIGHLYEHEMRIRSGMGEPNVFVEEYNDLKHERQIHEEMGWSAGRSSFEYWLLSKRVPNRWWL